MPLHAPTLPFFATSCENSPSYSASKPPANLSLTRETCFLDSTDIKSTFAGYQQFTATFWDAEKQLQIHDIPLSSQHNLYQKYFYVNKQVGQYVSALHSQNISESWTIPHALYLGGVAAFSIGNYANAQKYFSQLLQEYPTYKRDSYISDNYNPDPQYSQPAEPGVSKLLFYCQIATSTNSSPNGRGLDEGKNAHATFQQFNQSAIKVLLSQRKFADWLTNRPHSYQRRDFYIDENYGEQLDQLRASALPKTSALIKDGWDKLFPIALKKDGAPKMRTYLRELAKPDSPLQEIAASRLAEVDQLVIKHYFAQAKVLLRKHKFTATRKKYQQIIAEYPDSDASRRAEKELPKVVPVAVNYYQKVADENFHSTQIGVPQNKAADYYKRMYEEDPRGSKADYALYYWARALGTQGKVKQEVKLLKQHLQDFPKSKMRGKAMYLLGFTYCNHLMRDLKNGIPVLLQVAKEFPKSEEAPEALWHAAIVAGQAQQNQLAVALLGQLKKQYPQNKRTKYADKWISIYQGGAK